MQACYKNTQFPQHVCFIAGKEVVVCTCHIHDTYTTRSGLKILLPTIHVRTCCGVKFGDGGPFLVVLRLVLLTPITVREKCQYWHTYPRVVALLRALTDRSMDARRRLMLAHGSVGICFVHITQL